MGYSKRTETMPKDEVHGRTTLKKIVLLAVLGVAIFCLMRVLGPAFSRKIVAVSHEIDEKQKDEKLHLTKFLGYEFGKVYSYDDEILKPWWNGFMRVSLIDIGKPLREMRFGKETYTFSAKEDVSELVSVFQQKYGIKFDYFGGLDARYDGKYTEIWIHFFAKDGMRNGTLTLEISDVALNDKWKWEYEAEEKQQKKDDFDRM